MRSCTLDIVTNELEPGTSIAADAGASMEDLMRLGPWKSITVCQRYIQESKRNKRKLGNLIGGAINLPSTSQSNSGKRFKTETSNENVSEYCDAPINLLSEAENFNAGDMASGAVKLNSAAVQSLSETLKGLNLLPKAENSDAGDMASGAVKSLSETLNGLSIQTRRDKENVILHFGAECKNFTIIYLN